MCEQRQPFCIVSLFLADKKVSRVLVDFLLFVKMDRRKCIKFCVKNLIKCAKIFKMLTAVFGESTMSRAQVQLRYNRLRKAETISMTILVLVSRARQQAMKTLKK